MVMKKHILPVCTLMLSYIIFFSCKKENNIHSEDAVYTNKLNASIALSCDQLIYPDSIFYPSEDPAKDIINPVNPAAGKFGAFPDGLDIDNKTGAIKISQSETGLRYRVWYVANGSTDTCYKFITIAGINYMDSIYHLGLNQKFAPPIYNATRQLGFDTIGCEFDDGPDDDDLDGFADEPLPGEEVIPQGVALNKSTGIMDLKASILNGALGPLPVPSGTSKEFILNYRMNDSSLKTLNSIKFKMFFYKTQSQIPDSLKREVRQKRSQILFNDEQTAAPKFTNYLPLSSPGAMKVGLVKCRPPYIIIVQK